MENLVYEASALGIDLILFGVLYRQYRKKHASFSAIKAAPALAIDNNLEKTLVDNGNNIKYAVVSGSVKSLSTCLRSQFVANVKGAIRGRITKERKIRWSPVLRIWTTMDNTVQSFHNTVPFALVGNKGWFSEAKVEVLEPLSADELTLTTIYDHFTSHEDTFGEAVVGWVRGERVTGIQEIEAMLVEGSVLTGIGQLTLENQIVKLKPPESGQNYILTSMSLESVIKKLREEVKFFKVISVVLGCVGIAIAFDVLMKLFKVHREKMALEKIRNSQREASRIRRMADPTRGAENNEETRQIPPCVICLTNPVEMLILECGHTCLCLNCSELIQGLCPVCRSTIDRIVPAYLP